MGACVGKHNNIKREIEDIYLPEPIKMRDKANNKNDLIAKFRESQSNNNNNNKTVSRIYRMSYLSADFDKKSFDFSDDLCETILSYLPFEDKFRFECVNKQFQRLVYNRVSDLEYPLNQLIAYENSFDEHKRLIISRKVLRKCQYVCRLKVWPICDSDVLSVLAKHSKSLETIDLCFNNLKPVRRDVLSQFADNCGHSLETIKIRELNELAFNSESGLALLIVYSEYLSKIRALSLSIDSDNCLKYFILLADIYSERITSLELRLRFSTSYTHLYETFKQISRFVRLETLGLILEFDTPVNLDISFGANLLANNCLKLQNITLELRGNGINCSENILKSFETFLTLKTLSLRICCSLNGVELGSLESLYRLRRLRELNILYKNLNDNHLTDIHIYCPKLESIQLKTLDKFSDNALHSLAKLRSLQKLRIFCKPYNTYDITDTGICDLINNCGHLRLFGFECGIRLTQLTLLTLNALADSSPNTRFLFTYCWERNEEQAQTFDSSRRISAREIWPELQNLPDNLTIVCGEYFVGISPTTKTSAVRLYENQFTWPPVPPHLNIKQNGLDR